MNEPTSEPCAEFLPYKISLKPEPSVYLGCRYGVDAHEQSGADGRREKRDGSKKSPPLNRHGRETSREGRSDRNHRQCIASGLHLRAGNAACTRHDLAGVLLSGRIRVTDSLDKANHSMLSALELAAAIIGGLRIRGSGAEMEASTEWRPIRTMCC